MTLAVMEEVDRRALGGEMPQGGKCPAADAPMSVRHELPAASPRGCITSTARVFVSVSHDVRSGIFLARVSEGTFRHVGRRPTGTI